MLHNTFIKKLTARVDMGSHAFVRDTLATLQYMALCDTQYAPREQMHAVQQRAFRSIMEAAKHTLFWGVHIKENYSLDVLPTLPQMIRSEVQADMSMYVNPSITPHRALRHFTSGSTGQPMEFFLDTYNGPNKVARHKRMMEWAGAPDDVVSVHLLPTQGRPGLEHFSHTFRPNVKSLDGSLWRFYVYLQDLKERGKKVVVETFPTYMHRLAQLIEAEGEQPPEMVAYIPVGEMLLEAHEAYIQKIFATKIIRSYTTREMLTIAQECGHRDDNAMHINSEYYFIEIVDDYGNRVPTGVSGHVLITSLENEAMPFIRYRIGDIGHLIEETCPCGRTLPLIVIDGRESHLIKLPSGDTISPISLNRVFNKRMHEIMQFQVVHTAPTVFDIQVVPAAHTARSNFLKYLIEDAHDVLGADVDITAKFIEHIPTTPAGKQIQYVRTY